MAFLEIFVDVRDKNTGKTYRRSLHQLRFVDMGAAIQAFDKGQAYETEDYSITKSTIQPKDVEDMKRKRYNEERARWSKD